jgi:prevent-host-death family protein
MERIGVRQLQQNAAAAMRRVRRGERLQITDRGRPIAVLSPADAGDALEALDAAGRLTRAQEDFLELPDPIRVPARTESASNRLMRLRSGER